MNSHVDKTQEIKSQAVAKPISQNQSSGEQTFQFVDNRPETILQRKLQTTMNNGSKLESNKGTEVFQLVETDEIAEGAHLYLLRSNINTFEQLMQEYAKRLEDWSSNRYNTNPEWTTEVELIFRRAQGADAQLRDFITRLPPLRNRNIRTRWLEILDANAAELYLLETTVAETRRAAETNRRNRIITQELVYRLFGIPRDVRNMIIGMDQDGGENN